MYDFSGTGKNGGLVYQFVFSPDTQVKKQYKSRLFADPGEAASHALHMIREFAKA